MSGYLVDSNFFIQAHRAIYPIGIANSFWTKVKDLADRKIIQSIDKVKKEIYHNEDDLKDWCIQNLDADFFHDSSIAINEYRSIAIWAGSMSHHYRQTAIQEFLATDLADSWLVAYGAHAGYKVVTYEKSAPGGKKRIKIPEVCNQFNVSYLNTIEMFRELGEGF